MSKVKIIERSFVEKEIDLEYPFYLYYQGEYALSSEYIKVDKYKSLHVNYETISLSVAIKNTPPYELYQIENNLIKEEEFNEIFIDALSQIKQK